MHLGHQLFIDQAGENRDHNLQAGLVGDPQSIDEARRNSLALHPLGDHVAPTVDHHNIHPLIL